MNWQLLMVAVESSAFRTAPPPASNRSSLPAPVMARLPVKRPSVNVSVPPRLLSTAPPLLPAAMVELPPPETWLFSSVQSADRGRAAQVVDGAAEIVEADRRDGLVAAQVAAGHAEARAEVVEDRAATTAARGRIEVHRGGRLVTGQGAVLTLRLAPTSLKIAPPPRPPMA